MTSKWRKGMKKIGLIVLAVLLLASCLTGCRPAGSLSQETGSSSEEVSVSEGEPDYGSPIDAEAVMGTDIFAWGAMDDKTKQKWAEDVLAIWKECYDTTGVSAETILSKVNTALQNDSEQANIFELACTAYEIDSSLFYPQEASESETTPAADESSEDSHVSSGQTVQVDTSSLKYDIFDWNMMNDADRIKAMNAYITIWQAGGIKVNKTAEALLADVTAALAQDNEQANIFETACATQGIDPTPFHAE